MAALARGAVLAGGRWSFGTRLARTLFLEVTGGIQPFRAFRHLAVIGSVPMPGTALTKVRVAGLLEAVEELLVGVPAVATGVAASPGAQLLTWATGTGLLALATARFAFVPAKARGVRSLGS